MPSAFSGGLFTPPTTGTCCSMVRVRARAELAPKVSAASAASEKTRLARDTTASYPRHHSASGKEAAFLTKSLSGERLRKLRRRVTQDVAGDDQPLYLARALVDV